MRNLAIAVTIAVAALTAACSRSHSEHHGQPLPPDQAARVLTERVWLDHLPRTQHERFHLAVFDRGGIGVAQVRSVWKGEFELFRFAVDGDRLLLARPSNGNKAKRPFRIETEHDGPSDVRLIIDDNPLGPRTYWGFRPDGETADEWVKSHAPTAE